MKRAIVLAIDAALCASFAAGCATRTPPPQVVPVLHVRHGGVQADGYYQLGRFLQEQQRHDDAAAAYRKALALDPHHADAHNGLGTLYASRGRFDDARSQFEAALARSPSHAAVLNNLGYTLLMQQRGEEALAPLQAAVQLEPDNARYRANLALAMRHPHPSQPPDAPVADAPDTIDAVPAQTQPALTTLEGTDGETNRLRLVRIRPNVFELVAAPVRAMGPEVAVLPVSLRRAGVEVSNGNGATGLARRIGRQLAAAGVPVARLTNQTPYGATASFVQYRPGHERTALDLSFRVPGRPAIVVSMQLRSDIDVRLVLGRELPPDVALLAAQRFARGVPAD